jgi:aspartyl/asparaginyl beta-hydroxylase (cupin superfamily)
MNEKFFLTIDDFPQFKILEDNYEILLEELMSVINDQNRKMFEPWVEKNLYQESNENGWDIAPLMIGGVRIEERIVKFPKLFSLINNIQGVMSVSYSLLKPGTHIVPHKGYDDYSQKVLRYHMGMIVPKGDVAIRVEKDTMKWSEGKSFIFDDYMVHEAWNFTNENRIVLIIDFLKKEYMDGTMFLDANFTKATTNYLK